VARRVRASPALELGAPVRTNGFGFFLNVSVGNGSRADANNAKLFLDSLEIFFRLAETSPAVISGGPGFGHAEKED
jgi:hypothetical protein